MPVRDAHAADAEAIARVHVDSWRTTYKGIIPQSYLDGLNVEMRANYWRHQLGERDGPERQPGLLPEWTIVLAEEDEQVVGFAAGGAERTGHASHSGELGAIYLLQEYQGRGIGRRLAEAMAGRLAAQGHSSMLVWVLAKNPARGFYEALGGRLIDRQTITLAGARLDELAYGWDDILLLARHSAAH